MRPFSLILHGDVMLPTVERVALGDGEQPASDGRFLWYVKLLQPHVAVPTILGQLLGWFGREL